MGLTKAEAEELAQLEKEMGGLSAEEEKEFQALESEFGSPKTGAVETGIEQFAKGVPVVGSYLPQMQAAASKPIYGLLNKLHGTDIQPDNYLQERDSNIARQELQEQERPGLSLAANLAGGISSAGALPAVSAATRLGRIGQGAKIGAGIGLLSNPGDVKGEVDGLQIGDRAIGGVVGGVTGGAGQGLLEAPGALKDKFKSSAERSAFKALGPYSREARQAMAKDKVESIGRTVLDEGVIGKIPRSYETLEGRAKSSSELVGKELDDYINALSKKSEQLGINVDKKDIAEEVAKNLTGSKTEIPGVLEKNAKVQSALERFSGNADEKPLSLAETEGLKRALGKEIKWDRLPGADIPVEEEINRALYSKTRGASEGLAQRVEDEAFGKGTGVFKGLKETYGNLETAEDILGKRNAKEFSNRMVSPSDYMTGGIGALAGVAAGDDPVEKAKYGLIGAGLGGVNKIGRLYGNQVMAKSKDALSKGFGGVDESTIMGLLKRNPKAAQGLLYQLYGQPEAEGF